jgi:hypothetical protein
MYEHETTTFDEEEISVSRSELLTSVKESRLPIVLEAGCETEII